MPMHTYCISPIILGFTLVITFGCGNAAYEAPQKVKKEDSENAEANKKVDPINKQVASSETPKVETVVTKKSDSSFQVVFPLAEDDMLNKSLQEELQTVLSGCQLTTQVTEGSFSLDATGNINFQPSKDYFGTVSADIQCSEGEVGGGAISLELVIQVLAVNDPPLAENLSATIASGTRLVLAIPATDVEGDILSAEISSPSSNAAEQSASGLAITYQSMPGFEGEDTIQFVLSDGKDRSLPYEIHITVTHDVSFAAESLTRQLDEDGSAMITLGHNHSIPEESTLRYSITENPSNGVVSITGNQATYLPNPNFYGQDNFKYTVTDQASGQVSAQATVSLQVAAQNDTPISASFTRQLPNAGTLTEPIGILDPDGGDSHEIRILNRSFSSAQADISVDNLTKSIVFAPRGNIYYGEFGFQFQIADSSGGLSPIYEAQVNVTGPEFQQIFTTSEFFFYDLGGVAGADAKCQAAADREHLSGTWKAIISAGSFTNPIHAKDRVDIHHDVYAVKHGPGNPFGNPVERLVQLDNTGEASFFSQPSLFIGRDETGAEITEFGQGRRYVWTATNMSGELDDDTPCNNWMPTANPDDFRASLGDLRNSASYDWIDYSPAPCYTNSYLQTQRIGRLYCIEQH